ncbi:MAG: serine/threonine-protein kinase [Gemmataceae bacterium]
MIAFSCRHCGERMQVTEDGGCRRAVCLSCGQGVSIPAGESGLRRARSTTAVAVRVTPAASQAVHQLPTRVEATPRAGESLTSFLTPAREPGEIGRLGPYRVLSLVGAGGMGVVFRAHDPTLDRVVALKAMLPSLAVSATARERFVREARLAAAIQHDHVVTIFQVGEDRGVPFLAMPFLRGESLDQGLARRGSLPAPEATRIARQIAEGLAAIHELGLVHRDIKPANVFLEGESSRVKILDFGLARAVGGDVQLTRDGTIVGSPAFMAPEQASRQAVDARADLFSLGCVLYQMLTGELPFEREDALATLLAAQTEPPTPPRDLCPEVPVELSELVLRMLEKRPQDRPASARAVAAALADQ